MSSQPTPGPGLPDKKVVLCLGSGGVGKTTVAAALALALAKVPGHESHTTSPAEGERVVVLTVDPARRLADTLGLRSIEAGQHRSKGNELEVVAGTEGRVFATMLDPVATFESVVREEATSDKQAERILNNPLFHNLTRSLSGTNEYMAAERLHQLYHDPRFDRVVIDTPPSRHALDFLDSPKRLSRFINHRLYRSVFAPRSGLFRTISAGGQMALKLLGRLVGSRLVDDVIDFFAAFEGLDAGFDRRANEIDQVLADDAAIILVTAARREPLEEARWIADNVARRFKRRAAVDTLVVNRLCPVDPVHAPNVDDQDEDVEHPEQTNGDPLALNLAQLATVSAQEQTLVEQFRSDLGDPEDSESRPALIKLYEQQKPISDLAGLNELSGALAPQLSTK